MVALDPAALSRHRSALFAAIDAAMADVRILAAEGRSERARAEAVRDRVVDLVADPAVAAALGPSADGAHDALARDVATHEARAQDALAAVDHIEDVLGARDTTGRRRLRSRFLRLAQDADGRHALYLHVGRGRAASPIHHHGTWAAVVGMTGVERNRFWRRVDDGVAPAGELALGPGVGVAMTGEDLHSVALDGPALHLHCYGLALERLDDRDFYDAEAGAWRPFTNRVPIDEARPGLT